jgi:hypothetical protein
MKNHPFLSGDNIWQRIDSPRLKSGLYSQTCAAFGAASSNNCTTTFGAHTNQEAMGALAAHDRRLIRAFHVGIPLMCEEKRAITPRLPHPCQAQLFIKAVDNLLVSR